jgi:hypothetical protein
VSTHSQWTSKESAAASPLARYLRSVAPNEELLTITSRRIAQKLGYSTATRLSVVSATLKDLSEWGVLEYTADRGIEATFTVRVLK